jgi:hypothetical protein
MINLFVFVIFSYLPPIGGMPLENPAYRDIQSKFLLQGTYQKWTIQSLDYNDPNRNLSYNYSVFVPERLYLSFGCKSFNIITGLEKSYSFSFKGNYTIKDNFYPLFLGIYTKDFLMRFFGAYGSLSSSDETVNFIQTGGEFSLFCRQEPDEFEPENFFSIGFKMLRSEFSDKFLSTDFVVLGVGTSLIKRDSYRLFLKTGLQPYILSYSIYNPEKGLWVHNSFFAELGIRQKTKKHLWEISLSKKDLLPTGNMVGFSIGGLEIKGIYEFFLKDWSTGVSLAYFLGGDEDIVEGNIIKFGLKLCKR